MSRIKNLLLGSAALCMMHVYSFFQERYDYYCPNKTLIWGAIQFPSSLEKVPDIRIYYSGQRIKCETNQETKRITFAIPDTPNKNHYTYLISDNLDFASEHNVIKYLKVKEKSSYKFYYLDLVYTNPLLCSLDMQDLDASRPPKMAWAIKEYRHTLDKGRIPDDTIIICFKPDYIEHIEGSNTSALPTIKIKSDVLKLAGSEKKLHENSDELILSLMDYDTIHAAIHQEEVRPAANPKTILSITT